MSLIKGSQSRCLVVVRAGRQSLHQRWIDEAGPLPFDLLVAAYEENVIDPSRREIQHILIPGPKVQGIATLFRRHSELLRDYSYIGLVDDDIDVSVTDLMLCFEIGASRHLEIWQPSLTWDSYFSYAAFLHNPLYKVRYTNFIEMQVPFFSAEALRRCLPLFDLGYETGIDQLWCRLSTESLYKYAVVDEISVRHTRPVGATAQQQGFDSRYDDSFRSLHARLSTSFHGPVVYAGILVNGHEIQSRIGIACLVPCVLPGLFSARVGRGFFLMRTLDHARHNLTRPINNSLISIPDRTMPD